jgi:SEFIR domain-containing protein
MVDRPPRVFISYSHDSDDHAARVLALADRLRAEGIDAALDQYEISPPEGWPSWMERQVRESDFVLVVCTEIYLRRAERREEPGVGHGVTFESTLSLQHLYDAGMRNTRFIPVVFEDRDIAHIPTPLRGANRYNIGTENGYEGLYRHLTGQAETPAPSLGKLRQLPRRERQWRSPPQVADPELPRPDPPKAADAFLRALHASSELGSSSTPMTTDRVNGLGEILGIAPRDLLEMVEHLQDKGLVKVHWGGSVSLTPTGKECAEGRKAGAAAPGSVTIGEIGQGAHVAIHSPEAVVGYQATGHGSIGAGATVGAGAIRIEAPLGDLVAALQGLRTVRATLDETDQEPTRALEEEVAATVREVQQPSPDKVGLERRLERLRGLVERLSGVTEAAGKLQPALAAIGTAAGAIARWLGLPWPG